MKKERGDELLKSNASPFNLFILRWLIDLKSSFFRHKNIQVINMEWGLCADHKRIQGSPQLHLALRSLSSKSR